MDISLGTQNADDCNRTPELNEAMLQLAQGWTLFQLFSIHLHTRRLSISELAGAVYVKLS